MTKEVQEIREEFPLLKEVVWLASAGVGPMPWLPEGTNRWEVDSFT